MNRKFVSSSALCSSTQLQSLKKCLKKPIMMTPQVKHKPFEQHSCFKSGQVTTEDFKPSDHPPSKCTDESTEKVHRDSD
jgi:hypothetical protein